MRIRRLRGLAGVAGVFCLSGCGTMHYLLQAGEGQLALFNHARPISEVLQDERTPPRVKALLSEIEPIKKFGILGGLRATPNYREYVKLDRPAAVWVVSACEPLRFKAKEWSFPIVGSFPYLGWFDLKDAKEYASGLRDQGLDVDVRGARAYSTLGWFRDAVLSSMIPEGDEALGELVNVVLHESVHATLYIKGESYFNESVASFMADRMTPDYLKQSRGADSKELVSYLASEQENLKIERELHQAYERLDQLYRSDAPPDQKLTEKGKLLSELKERLRFRREINNATLIQYKTYNTGQGEFERLYSACGRDWKRFLGALGTLRPESFQQPQQEDLKPVLDPLTDSGCHAG